MNWTAAIILILTLLLAISSIITTKEHHDFFCKKMGYEESLGWNYPKEIVLGFPQDKEAYVDCVNDTKAERIYYLGGEE